MQRGIGRLRARAGGGVDADASAWATAVTANSGTYSGTTLAALSTFIASAKASGYWPKIAPCFNPMCGDQLAACLIQLKGGVWAPATNVNFVSGDYTEATGLTGNGTTKYLRTGLIPSVSLTLNDTHLAVYNRTSAIPGASTVHIGVRSSPNFFELMAPQLDGSIYSRQYDDTNGKLISAVLTGPWGLVVGSRTTSTAHSIYRAGSSVGSNITGGGALLALEAYVFAVNSAGSAALMAAQALAAYSIGSGLSAADVTAYNTHLQTFQTSLSRNV